MQNAADPSHVAEVEVAEVGYDGGGEGVIVAARLDRDRRRVARVPLPEPVVRHDVGRREALGRLEAQHAAHQRLEQRVHVRRHRELALADRLEEPACGGNLLLFSPDLRYHDRVFTAAS